jgi:hypothetical protein
VHYRAHYRDLAARHVAGEPIPMGFGAATPVRRRQFEPR